MGLFVKPEFKECVAQVKAGVGKAGLDGKSTLITGNCPLTLTQLIQCVAKTIVRLGVVRLQFQGPLVGGERVIKSTKVSKGVAQIEVPQGVAGCEQGHYLHGFQRLSAPVQLPQGCTQHLPAKRMLRELLCQLARHRFCRAILASIETLHQLPNYLRRRCWAILFG